MADSKEKILRALDRSVHRWRTARSIAAETGISIDNVTRILRSSPAIARAKKGNDRGEALYARKAKQRAEPADALSPSSQAPSPVADESSLPTFKFLVLLPFDASVRRLRDVINKTVRQGRAEPLFLDEIRAGAVWVDEISRLVGTSGAVIADVTRLSPNIMFELGVAHGLGRPLVLLVDETASTKLPSDLSGYHFITYSPDNLSPLIDRLGKTIQQIIERREAT